MGGEITRTEAEITAMGVDGREIASWKLEGVIPVRWSGPSLNVETAKVATETLELAHHGFLPG
jgi:phage tail-like protein